MCVSAVRGLQDRTVHASLLVVCSLASDRFFTGGVQRERRGDMLTRSSKIFSDLIIATDMTLHTERRPPAVSPLCPHQGGHEWSRRDNGLRKDKQTVAVVPHDG